MKQMGQRITDADLLAECVRLLGLDPGTLARQMTGQKSYFIRLALQSCHVTLDLEGARARNPKLSPLAIAEAESVFHAARIASTSALMYSNAEVAHGQDG